ncbi:methionine ABC transporter ATP-binding protein [Natranaerobius trueperi]|uniref:Methionine ABC transporter ATP-binding protein n=1 Tax=Natranaerobius trueperi TaxID=759412 RepID=A0A226C0U5_9FIRM|nr:methionine ABC transporter ATP-binding protein [Natranaerobius trueperi]OWZ84652.1 methionine ABC transporter ATP-binding protein [Natranaerobius trueperi]
MIKITNLTKLYKNKSNKVQALKNVNLNIEKGEIFGIAGYSGAGKSTLIRCVNLIERPTSGSVTIDGIEVSNLTGKELRKTRQKIGMIFQHFNLLSSRTAYENIALPLEIAGVDKGEINKKVTELLKLVGLEDKAESYPSQLSGGQKQRVGIARALANDPKILLCDEATSALDPDTTKSILNLLQDINEKYNLTILIITHEIKVIKEICDSVAIMESGKVIESGKALDIFTKPKEDVTKNFVKSVTEKELPSIDYSGYDTQIVKVSFIGNKAKDPIISSLIKNFNVDTNIISGNIDHIKGTPFGTLVLELIGSDSDINKAKEYLTEKDLGLEVLKNGRHFSTA